MTREIYRIVLESPLTFVASVIDEKLMQDKYSQQAYSPSGFAYELIMERYQFSLQELKARGDVVIDEISGKSPRGHPYRLLLQNLHRRLQRYGSTGQKVCIDRVVGSPQILAV